MISRTVVAALVFTSAFTAACALSTKSIADIQRSPGRFSDRSVSIEGTVTSSFGGPFVPVNYYKIDDGTGEMTVISNGVHGVPRKGARVKVRGRVEELAALGNRSYGLHIREEELDVRR